MKRLAPVLLMAACAQENAAPSVYIPPDDTQVAAPCTLTALAGGMPGECYARWVCKDEGVRTLACGGLDAGVGCDCLQAAQPATHLVEVPADCSAAASVAVTAFAHDKCGWGDL